MGEKIFTQLEALAEDWQRKYMSSRLTTEVIESGRIRFHPQDAREWILKAYRQRLKKLGLSF